MTLLGRATLQNWSLVLYGTKQFKSVDENSYSKQNKVEIASSKKKQNKKQKSRNPMKATVPSKSIKNKIKQKSKPTSIYSMPINLYSQVKKKPMQPIEGSSFHYTIDNTKFRTVGENVKEYLKFVKNITITYPIMIPSVENVKSRDPLRKMQKQKEKSRDLNSKPSNKLITARPPLTKTTTYVFTTKHPEKTTGK